MYNVTHLAAKQFHCDLGVRGIPVTYPTVKSYCITVGWHHPATRLLAAEKKKKSFLNCQPFRHLNERLVLWTAVQPESRRERLSWSLWFWVCHWKARSGACGEITPEYEVLCFIWDPQCPPRRCGWESGDTALSCDEGRSFFWELSRLLFGGNSF